MRYLHPLHSQLSIIIRIMRFRLDPDALLIGLLYRKIKSLSNFSARGGATLIVSTEVFVFIFNCIINCTKATSVQLFLIFSSYLPPVIKKCHYNFKLFLVICKIFIHFSAMIRFSERFYKLKFFNLHKIFNKQNSHILIVIIQNASCWIES